MKRQTTVKQTKDWSTRTLPNKNDNNTENSSPCNAIGSKHSKRNYAEDDPFCYAWLVCSEVLRWPLRSFLIKQGHIKYINIVLLVKLRYGLLFNNQTIFI
jgi:hypothetical protein